MLRETLNRPYDSILKTALHDLNLMKIVEKLLSKPLQPEGADSILSFPVNLIALCLRYIVVWHSGWIAGMSYEREESRNYWKNEGHFQD